MVHNYPQKGGNSIYNSRTADKFVVRLPDGMRETISALAREDKSSMNTLIVKALEAAYCGGPAVTSKGWTPVIGMALIHVDTGVLHVLKGIKFEFGEIWLEVTREEKGKTIPDTYVVDALQPLIITS